MDLVWKELVYAARALRRDRVPVAVAVACLALAMAAATTMFAVADAVIFRPLPCPAPEQLVVVSERHPQRGLMAVRPANFADWHSRVHVFAAASPAIAISVNSPDDHRHLTARLVGADFFRTWDVQPHLGRPFAADDYRRAVSDDFFGHRGGVVVISHAYWQARYGGDAAVLGRFVQLDSATYQVVGVMPASFAVIDKSDMWIPWIVDAAALDERRFHYFPIVARLRAGITIQQAQQELADIYQTLAAEHAEDRDWTVVVERPRQLLLGRTPTAIRMLLAAVCLVLLIACANVSNILIARGIRRRNETALRLALGATRSRLVLADLAEASIVGTTATALGLVLTSAAIRIVSTTPAIAHLPFTYASTFDYRVFAFSIVTALTTVVTFGVGPGWLDSRTDVVVALRSRLSARADANHHAPRSALVVAEVALGLFVVVLMTLTARSLLRLTDVEPGMRTADILTMRLEVDDDRYPGRGESARFFERVLDRVRALPGVEGAATASYVPLTSPDRSWRFDVFGQVDRAAGHEDFAIPSEVSRQFFATLDVTLLQGRVFGQEDRAGSEPVVVISQTAARRYFGGQAALGQRLKIAGLDPWFRIVGVVADVYQASLERDPAPALYVLQDQTDPRATTLFVATAGDPAAATAMIRNGIHDVDPDQAIDDVRAMTDVYDTATAEPRFRMWALACFAALSLALAAAGLYSVMIQLVGERTHEIGVRMALGAQPGDAAALILKQAAVLVGIGIAAGTLAALGGARLIRGLLFGVAATDAASFAIAAAVLVLVALSAVSLPLYRAAHLDISRTLRME